MQKMVQKLDDQRWEDEFPIVGSVEGWRFRLVERSPGAYCATAADQFGRLIERDGSDPDQLLAECERAAALLHSEGNEA